MYKLQWAWRNQICNRIGWIDPVQAQNLIYIFLCGMNNLESRDDDDWYTFFYKKKEPTRWDLQAKAIKLYSTEDEESTLYSHRIYFGHTWTLHPPFRFRP